MSYLLAQIVVLLVLAAALGALFEHWRLRRHYVDVTIEYRRLKDNWQSWRKGFEEKLIERPAVDLSPVTAAVSAIRIPPTNPLDLGPVLTRFDKIEKALDQLKVAGRAVDVAEFTHQLAELETRIRSSQESKHDAVYLTQMEHRLEQRFDEIDRAMRVIQVRMYREASFASQQALAAIGDDASLASRSMVTEEADRLRARVAIEQFHLHTVASPSVTQSGTAMSMVRSGSRNLLVSPVFGERDDLQRIKGVAKVLEALLHEIGVYYFWQIAEWSLEDVAYVDQQLAAFKGRIVRDNWVPQSIDLARSPGSALKPLKLESVACGEPGQLAANAESRQ